MPAPTTKAFYQGGLTHNLHIYINCLLGNEIGSYGEKRYTQITTPIFKFLFIDFNLNLNSQ